MAETDRQLPSFEPFKVRQLSFFEFMLRLEWIGAALLLWVMSFLVFVQLIRDWRVERIMLFPLVILTPLALLLTVAAARRFVSWRIDDLGIHQRCLGIWNWDLFWLDIVSCDVGKPRGKRWLILLPIPILTGNYQAIILEDRWGRKRNVNRLALNGERLDALVRLYLNPTEEMEIAERYRQAVETAQEAHERQELAHAPLLFVTRETPSVRVRLVKNEGPQLPPVCCNCLGRPRKWAMVYSAGLWSFFRPSRLYVLLCADCHARTKRRILPLAGWYLVAAVLLFWGLIGFVSAADNHSIVMGIVGASICASSLWVVVRRIVRRPLAAKLVEIACVNAKEGWMDLRFGNEEYRRITADLNLSS
jgi:hypothetical protein